MGEVARLAHPMPGLPLEGRDLERAVDRVIEHHLSELAKQIGDDDPYVQFMRSIRHSAQVLPFCRANAADDRKE